jgi:type II secretory pathway component PulF
MIRARAGNIYIFGLAKENIKRLTEGNPIIARLNEYELNEPAISIMICYSETEEKLAFELQELMNEDTKITDYRTNQRRRK